MYYNSKPMDKLAVWMYKKTTENGITIISFIYGHGLIIIEKKTPDEHDAEWLHIYSKGDRDGLLKDLNGFLDDGFRIVHIPW